MFYKLSNFIYIILLLFLFGILSFVSFKNIINFKNITTDKIKSINVRTNEIITLKKNDTIEFSEGIKINIGDSINYRNKGIKKSDKILFQVNDKKIASMYDEWDLISPILFLISSFFFVGLLIAQIKKLK